MYHKKIVSFQRVTLFSLVVSVATTFVHSAAFSHPGILHGVSDIQRMKDGISKNQEPWKSAYERLKASDYAKSTYVQKPYESVQCGSYNNPNVGCNEMVNDGMAAYSNALMFVLGGPQAHADKAKEILDGWSAIYRENTESNARLVVSWAAPWYTNAAELLRYENSGWTIAKINQFKAMLMKWLPYVKDEFMPGNNWIQSAIEAHIAMAVFLDDSTEFNSAVDRWKFRVTTYIYQATDRADKKPINSPNKTDAQMESIWRGKAASTVYLDGLAMETCRDLGHLKLGFNSMMYAAEVAWQQGVDVIGPQRKRLTDFLELHSGWMMGKNAVPSNICGGVVRTVESDSNSGVKPPNGGGQIAWEIAYNHLHDRLNASLLHTWEMTQKNRPTNIGRWVFKWETLTHAGRTFGPIVSNSPTIRWVIPMKDTLEVHPGYSLQAEAEASGSDGPNDISRVVLFVNGDSIRSELTAPYEWGHSSSPNPSELEGLSPGWHTIVGKAVDKSGLESMDTLYVHVALVSTGINFFARKQAQRSWFPSYDLKGRMWSH